MFTPSFYNICCALIAVAAVFFVLRKEKSSRNPNRILNYPQLQKAMEEHHHWKQRFVSLVTEVVKGTQATHDTQTLDRELVGKDDQCALGKWLYSVGMKDLGTHPDFIELVAIHHHFHQCAANTLQLTLDGKHKEVLEQISHRGEFEQVSQQLARKLLQLYAGTRP